MQRRPLRLATALSVIVASLVATSSAVAAQQVISSAGPLTNIHLTDLLGRRLWGRGRGRFRSRGRPSAASVRGTTWLVEDRCDGSTLTRVTSGKVTVRDFARRKSIRLRKGQSYVAKKRRKRRRG